MNKTESACPRLDDELLHLLAQNRGQTHASIREACVERKRADNERARIEAIIRDRRVDTESSVVDSMCTERLQAIGEDMK